MQLFKSFPEKLIFNSLIFHIWLKQFPTARKSYILTPSRLVAASRAIARAMFAWQI